MLKIGSMRYGINNLKCNGIIKDVAAKGGGVASNIAKELAVPASIALASLGVTAKVENHQNIETTEDIKKRMLSNGIWPDIVSLAEKRGILSLKNADGNPFDVHSISALAKMPEKAFGNIKKRKLLKLRDANGKAFDGYAISVLSEMSDENFARIKERNLLTLKDFEGNAYSAFSVSVFAGLPERAFERIKERNLLALKDASGKPFHSCMISLFSQLSDSDFAKLNLYHT